MNPNDNARSSRPDTTTSSSQLNRDPSNPSQRKDGSASADPSLDTIFDILSHSYRRQILFFLSRTEDDLATVADLVTYISEHESGDETSTRRTRGDAVSIALHHNHLPKLEDAGMVEFDTRSETIRYRAHPLVEKCLAVIDTREK
ncbi:hypothetical protein [Haladaptatus sp. CMAA 1909]|uniref:DUF7344 domain-containing protein n=1 Tax=Haladaptatus sp. CMAA 1909 TaxID=3368986 RepID=UPI0037544EED